MRNLLLIHGPNLNLLGMRQPKHYGNNTLEELIKITKFEAQKYALNIIAFQSNHEGMLIDSIQKHSASCSGIIINAGAFSHYSYAIYDALIDTNLPVVEVHLSDIDKRESWRARSVISPIAISVIKGKKEKGYIEAVQILAKFLN